MLTTTTPLRRFNAPVIAVEPHSIDSRTEALVRTGNNQLAARFIAEKAAEQQALRDAGLKQEIEVRTRALVGTVAEVKLAGTSAPLPNTPVATVVSVPLPTTFDEFTIDQLRAHAVEHGLEVGADLRLKADIAAAVRNAHLVKYPVVSEPV